MRDVVGTIACLALAAALGGCQTASHTTSIGHEPPVRPTILYTPNELRDLTPAEKAALGKAMAKGLKHPDSARFRWLQFPRYPDRDTVTWCGMMDAKTVQGVQTGARPYIATVVLKQGKIVGGSIDDAGTDDASSQAIREQCQQFGWDPLQAT